MRGNESIMSAIEHGKRKGYQAGCRCELCKDAEADYRRGHRRELRERVGEKPPPGSAPLSLVTSARRVTPTCDDAAEPSENGVVAAVTAEIEALGGSVRPGLAAGALAMARILENPKAVSTQPAAFAKLADALEMLRKNSDGKKSKLASVRSMTKPQVKTG